MQTITDNWVFSVIRPRHGDPLAAPDLLKYQNQYRNLIDVTLLKCTILALDRFKGSFTYCVLYVLYFAF